MSLSSRINAAAEIITKPMRADETQVTCWMKKTDVNRLKAIAKSKKLKIKQLWKLILEEALEKLEEENKNV